MAIKFAQKTTDTKTPPESKATLKAKLAENAEITAIEVNKSEDGTDLFETKAETSKRKKKR
ncbi:hypothetical protein V9K92_13475 [Phyllobacterium sp. CCNWLW109]|uniref:hypothetical protein n=1 Tax=Phyllobacterium sp. CCNWLW109 TaxID=3127479 RepID=UPI000E0EBA61